MAPGYAWAGARRRRTKDENLNDVGDFMWVFVDRAVDIVEAGIGTSGMTGATQVANMPAVSSGRWR